MEKDLGTMLLFIVVTYIRAEVKALILINELLTSIFH